MDNKPITPYEKWLLFTISLIIAGALWVFVNVISR